MNNLERCDICDIRGGHDVHCVRYPHTHAAVTTIWLTRGDFEDAHCEWPKKPCIHHAKEHPATQRNEP